MRHRISIFGVAEKGEYYRHLHLQSLEELFTSLGQPSEEGIGLELAIQALLYERSVLYYRVKDEGYENEAYEVGLKQLASEKTLSPVSALAIPGVGDPHILAQADQICKKEKSFLIMNQKDFYDYMTATTGNN